jgi:hypothetical protein
MREITEIIVHCTATNSKWMADNPVEDVVKEITRWHVEERGWSDCGYHAVCHRNGEVGYARPINRTGAHCRGRNKGTIGVSLVGGRGSTADDAFSDNFTSEQADALRNLIEQYKKQFPSIVKVTGHNDYASKACPGFSVEDWYNG